MDHAPPTFRPLQAWLVVALSLAAYVVSNIDRQLIAILIVPIQRDLGISDTEFGAIQGAAYGLFYAFFCIPVAGLSDRFSRPLIMSVGLTFWSVATMMCAFAGGFWRLFLARACVGAGESTLLPAASSLIADVFPAKKLGGALGMFFIAPFVGSTGAFLLGGAVFHWLGEDGRYPIFGLTLHTWQQTFVIAAVPGILLALLIFFLIKEPRRERPALANTKLPNPPFSEVLRFFFQWPGVFLANIIGYGLLAICLYLMFAWAPAYLIRTGGMSSAEAGITLGFVTLVAGCAGSLLAGFLSDASLARGRNAGPFEVGIFASGMLVLIMGFYLLMPGVGPAVAMVGSATFFGAWSMAPSAAVIQLVAPPRLRSRMSAIFLVSNMFIYSAGIFGVGWLNDHFFDGQTGIATSLPLFCGVASLGSLLVLSLGRHSLIRAINGLPATKAQPA